MLHPAHFEHPWGGGRLRGVSGVEVGALVQEGAWELASTIAAFSPIY